MKKLTQALLVTILGSSTVPLHSADLTDSADRTTRIVGGTEAPESKFPWMAAIYFGTGENSEQGCGGTLISERWILTSALCMFTSEGELEKADDVTVLLGATDLESTDGEMMTVSQIIVHSDYDSYTGQNDIALMELGSAVDYEPIALPGVSSVPLDGETAIGTGWGTIEEGGESSSLLLEVEIPIVSHSACFPWYHLYDETIADPIQICAGGTAEGGRDTCYGDSGGPIFVSRGDQYVHAGITSGGFGCGLPGIPGYYTRVSAYIDWITSIMSPTTIYDGDSEGVIVAAEKPVVVLAENSMVGVSTGAGTVRLFQTAATNSIVVESFYGDADLYVFSSPTFSEESLVCFSYNTDPIDECTLDEIGVYYLFVLGWTGADYDLTTSNGLGEVTAVEVVTLEMDYVVSGNVLKDTTDIYRATEGRVATLTVIEGDADLSVYSNENLTLLDCRSEEVGSALDTCSYNIIDSEVFIGVEGNADTSYSLVVTNQEPVAEPEPTPTPTPEPEPEPEPESEVGSSLTVGTGSFSGVFALLTLLVGVTFRRRIMVRRD